MTGNRKATSFIFCELRGKKSVNCFSRKLFCGITVLYLSALIHGINGDFKMPVVNMLINQYTLNYLITY